MSARRLTLTTVGLSIRDELRVKSMLQLVEGKTASTWIYVDEPQADLAICEPDSALARAVLKQATQKGRPRCVSLVRQGAQPMEDTQSVYAPLRVSDFISLLDGVRAGEIDTSLNTQQLFAAARAEAAANHEGFALAQMLHDLLAKDQGHMYRIDWLSVSLYALPAQDVVFSTDELTPRLITDLAQSSSGFKVTEMPASLLPTRDGGFSRTSMQYLLWQCGQLGMATDLLPWLPRMARFRLQRWPDFGRLGHKAWQVRLTSILMNNSYTLQQMTGLVSQPIENVRAFLNSCDLCGFLRYEALSDAPVDDEPVSMKTVSRWSGLLRSIRNALHIGEA